ncbi:MAG: RIP metalloprotease RseP, partial [Gemmatimonadetes bacterium]|nr:RIP metalloprotease RseP [Gemmatimonadota bacterium]
FVLGVVVVVHEAGHFLVAKSVGIYCKVFSVGFGPKLLRRQFGETEYALSAFPFGGYVKMAGEGVMEDIQDSGTGDSADDLDPDGNPIPPERYFSSKTTWQRMAVVVAGPLMNLLLALVVCIGVVLAQGVTVNPITTLGSVDEEGPAFEAGLQVGDRIVEVAGQPVESWEMAIKTALDEADDGRLPVPLAIERDGDLRVVEYAPRKDDVTGQWQLGMWYQQDTRVGKVRKDGPADRAGLQRGDVVVAIDGNPVEDYGAIAEIINASIDTPLELSWTRDGETMSATVVPEAAEVAVSFNEIETVGRIYYEPYLETQSVTFTQGVRMGSLATWGFVTQTAGFLKATVTGKASKDAVSGPLRIAKFSGEMVRWGVDRLMLFLALFSVNLFLLNLLPIPVLDGGHAVFILYEMILGRRPNQRIQMMATQVGFVALLLLMAYVITMDVIHVVS